MSAAVEEALSTSFSLALKPGVSMVGGGALPEVSIPTMLMAVRFAGLSAGRLEAGLRRLEIPIIVRVAHDEILLDFRTIEEEELKLIRDGFLSLALPSGD